MIITSKYTNLNMPKASNMRIGLKKERNKIYLALLLRPVVVTTGGRRRPLLIVPNFKSGVLLGPCC